MAPYLFEPSSDDDSGTIEYPIFSLPAERQKPGPRSNGTSQNKRQEYEDAARNKFGDAIHEVDLTWARELYRDLATDDEITAYLRSPHSGYNNSRKRWTQLSRPRLDASGLHTSLISIISHILHHFYPSVSLPAGVMRSVMDSRNLLLPHDNGKHASSPSISIKATGPSFEVPRQKEGVDNADGVGYTNVAGVIDVRQDGVVGDELEQATVLSVYCRYVHLNFLLPSFLRPPSHPNYPRILNNSIFPNPDKYFCTNQTGISPARSRSQRRRFTLLSTTAAERTSHPSTTSTPSRRSSFGLSWG